MIWFDDLAGMFFSSLTTLDTMAGLKELKGDMWTNIRMWSTQPNSENKSAKQHWKEEQKISTKLHSLQTWSGS